VRFAFPLLLTAGAIFVPGGAARDDRSASSGPLLAYSVDYRVGGVAGDGGICATGPSGHSFRVTDPYEDASPSWSPDGNRIAFTRYLDLGRPPARHNDISDIFVADAQGRHLRNLSAVSADIGGNMNIDPAWSPDGTKVAFVGGWYGASIFIVNADESGGRSVRDFGYPTWPDSPSWSPDGRRLLFGVSGEIRGIDVDGSHEQTLVSSGFGGSWSPDGQRIAYLRVEQDSTTSLIVANADGSAPKVIAENVGRSSGGPAWSPDGQWIAVAGSPGNTWGILLVRPDGTEPHLARTGRLPVSAPAWRPAAPLPRNRRPCAIIGTRRADVLRGTNRGDLILGARGNDTIYGLGGDDTISGGSGHDRLYGGPGRDLFGAQDGTRDQIFGGPGFDSAYYDKRDRLTSIELNEAAGGKP